MQLVNPHAGGHRPPGRPGRPHVTAARPDRPPRRAGAASRCAIAGAGRMWDLDGVEHHHPRHLAARAATAVALVHEWYADGRRSDRRCFLGASMTKSVLAHLVGIAVGSGALRLEDHGHRPRARAGRSSGYAELHGARRAHDDVRRRLGRGPPRPERPGHAGCIACFVGDGGARATLLAEIGPQDPPGTRCEYCTADSQVLDWVRERATGAAYDEALGELWAHARLRPRRGRRRRREPACRWPAAAWPPRRVTGCGWRPLQLDRHGVRRPVLDRDWIERAARRRTLAAPGRLPSSHHHPRRLRLPLVAARRRRATGHRRRQPRPVRLRRPRPRAWWS